MASNVKCTVLQILGFHRFVMNAEKICFAINTKQGWSSIDVQIIIQQFFLKFFTEIVWYGFIFLWIMLLNIDGNFFSVLRQATF